MINTMKNNSNIVKLSELEGKIFSMQFQNQLLLLLDCCGLQELYEGWKQQKLIDEN